MSEPFFVTHDQDRSAKRDAQATLVDAINNNNLIVARVGMCGLHRYSTYKERGYKQCSECGMRLRLPEITE